MTDRPGAMTPKSLLPCRDCGEQKGQDAFTASDWKRYVKKSRCRACTRRYWADRYPKFASTMRTLREERLVAVHAIKAARGCRDCGENHPACLDFHHRNPAEKKYSIGALTCGQATMQTLLSEIEKCDVLCSNCHRKHHWNEKRSERGNTNVLPLPELKQA